MVSPSIENFVSSISVNINGNKIGKDNTGYKVPFVLALEIIAAIIVEETAIPILPRTKESQKSDKFPILKDSNNTKKRNVITKFIKKTRSILKRSFPEYTEEGDASNCSVSVVPRSSSETKARERPDIAEKKITTHNKPPVRYSDKFSCPTENNITLIVTSINITSAFIA